MRGSVVYCLLFLLFGTLWYEATPGETPDESPSLVNGVITLPSPIHTDGSTPVTPRHTRYAVVASAVPTQHRR